MKSFVITKEDVLIETLKKDGFVSANDTGITVVIDTNLTPELIEEGFVRELLSKIQTMRKEAGFDVTDRITVTYQGTKRIEDIFARFGDSIAKDTLADCVTPCEPTGYVKEWDINGEGIKLGVKKQ